MMPNVTIHILEVSDFATSLGLGENNSDLADDTNICNFDS